MLNAIKSPWLYVIILIFCGCQGPAVKRGQLNISNDVLPLACLTLGVEGGGWPLEKVIFENATTHKTVTFTFGKTFNSSHPDYLTAFEKGNNVLCMAIVHLEPGDYFVQKIVFSPNIRDKIATTEFAFSAEHGYRFSVSTNAANYLGTLYIALNWRMVDLSLWSTRHGEFPVRYNIVATQQRDKKWAEDVIPAMRKIPSIFGHMDAF